MQIYFFKQQENNFIMSLAEILANKTVADLFERICTNPANADFVKVMDANLKNPKVEENANVKKAVAALTYWINLPSSTYPVHCAPELCIEYDKQQRQIMYDWVRELAISIANAIGL